jgi:long-subunit fatty acid transport protein
MVKKIEKKRVGYRKIMPWICMVFVAALVSTGANAGFFELAGQGARPVGLGEVFMLSSADASGYWYNPAGLAGIEKTQATLSYGGLQSNYDLPNYLVNLTNPLGGRSGIGLGVFASTADGANQIVVSGAYGLALGERLALGANVKVMRWQIEGQADPYSGIGAVDEDFSKMTFGIDASGTFKLGNVLGLENTTIGGYARNINNPNISESGDDTGALAPEIGGGLSGKINNFVGEVNAGILDEGMIFRGGIETIVSELSIRGGGVLETSSLDENENRTGFSLGLGYTFRQVVFDYAFNYLLNLEEGRHFVTLGKLF